MNKTQLLCTFTAEESLEVILESIINSYDVAFNSIYVLRNIDEDSLCLTYNVYESNVLRPPPSTISLHRKKITNTLYTINALNLLIESLNGGRRDNKFQVPWENYENCILVTAYGALKVIKTELLEIRKLDNQ